MEQLREGATRILRFAESLQAGAPPDRVMPLPSGFVGALREALGAPGVSDDPSITRGLRGRCARPRHAPMSSWRPADSRAGGPAVARRLSAAPGCRSSCAGAGTGYTVGAVGRCAAGVVLVRRAP
jgi:hypothetical protein